MTCRRKSCLVPGDVPHRHRPPNAAEIAEATYTVTVTHPPHCAWRLDVYEGCSCGVTAAEMALADAMRREAKP